VNECLGGRYARHGVTYTDAWFLYAVLADTRRPIFVAKVGISTTPLRRIAAVHEASPFPIVAGIWAMVGGRSAAASAEARIRKAFSDRRTQADWYEFDQTSHDDRSRFNLTIRSLAAAAAHRPLEWHRLQQGEIQRYLAAAKLV